MMNARSRRQSREAGFTLIELLGRVGIRCGRDGVAATLVRAQSGWLDVVATQVATSLRSAREAAVAFGQPVIMHVAADGSRFQFSTARAAVQLPQGVRVRYEGIAGFNRAGLGDELTFFVDGTSRVGEFF